MIWMRLTVDADVDSLADWRRYAVGGDAEVHAHIQSTDPGEIQQWSLHLHGCSKNKWQVDPFSAVSRTVDPKSVELVDWNYRRTSYARRFCGRPRGATWRPAPATRRRGTEGSRRCPLGRWRQSCCGCRRCWGPRRRWDSPTGFWPAPCWFDTGNGRDQLLGCRWGEGATCAGSRVTLEPVGCAWSRGCALSVWPTARNGSTPPFIHILRQCYQRKERGDKSSFAGKPLVINYRSVNCQVL